MKMKLMFLLICTCFAASAAFAQVDRRLTNQVYEKNTKKKKQEKVDPVELAAGKLTQLLELDSFQEAVITEQLETNQVAEQKILASDIPDSSKAEQIIALRNRLREKMKEILRPEQIEKFDNLHAEKKR